MSEQCIYCLGKFRSQRYLLHHQKTAKYCRNYHSISFLCQKCGFSTQGIQNIDQHLSHCTGTLKDKTQSFNSQEEYIKELENENREIKLKLTNYSQTNTLLALEKAKSEIWRNLLELNTNIRTKDIIDEKENIVNFYPIKAFDTSIFLYKYIKEESCKSISIANSETIGTNTEKEIVDDIDPKTLDLDDESTIPKKYIYRSVKNRLELVPEKDSHEREAIITLVDKRLEPKDNNNYTGVNLSFETLFDRIKSNRVYTKILRRYKGQAF